MEKTNGQELKIYVDGKAITALTPTDFPAEGLKEVTTKGADTELTFAGLYEQSEDFNPVIECIYTANRKGVAYFKTVNHDYVKSFTSNDPELLKPVKGMKRNTRLNLTITEIPTNPPYPIEIAKS